MPQVVLYENNKREWNSFVYKHPYSTFFHQLEWKNVIEKSYHHQSFYLVAREDGHIKGILPLFLMKHILFGKFLISVPFGDYGGICAEDEYLSEALLFKAVELVKRHRAKYLELRHLKIVDNEILLSKTSRVSLILPLDSDPEKVWNSFKSEIRNRIRKANRSGLNGQIGSSVLFEDFYKFYAHSMRNMGTPVHSRSFFSHVLSEFPDNTSIILIRLENRVIGGAIATYFKDTMEIPWVAFLDGFMHLCPSNLLYWKAIEHGCLKGCNYFNFGRSPRGSGPFEFKKRWGTKPVQLYYQYYLPNGGRMPDYTPSTNSRFDMAIKIWKKLPIGITKVIGPRIIAGIPY